MSQPPPLYFNPAHARRRSRIITGFVAILGIANVIAAMYVTATHDFANAITNAFIAILCLTGAAVRLWRIHSRFDRRF
jgi:hypothetical protein